MKLLLKILILFEYDCNTVVNTLASEFLLKSKLARTKSKDKKHSISTLIKLALDKKCHVTVSWVTIRGWYSQENCPVNGQNHIQSVTKITILLSAQMLCCKRYHHVAVATHSKREKSLRDWLIPAALKSPPPQLRLLASWFPAAVAKPAPISLRFCGAAAILYPAPIPTASGHRLQQILLFLELSGGLLQVLSQ